MDRRLLALVPLLAFAGCGDTPRENAAPEPDEGDCGAYAMTNAYEEDDLPDRTEKQQCLLDAFAGGRRVHLDVELDTEDGDPLHYRYTVMGPGLVEVRSDTTHDAFAPRAATELCTSLTVDNGYLAAEGCTSR